MGPGGPRRQGEALRRAGSRHGLAVAAGAHRVAASGHATTQDSGPEAGAASVFEPDGTGGWRERPLTPRVRPEARDDFGRGLVLASDVVYVGAEEDDEANGVDAGGIFALSLAAVDAPARLVIPADGAPRSYLGFALAATDRRLAVSEDTEVRLFDLGSGTASGGARLSTALDRAFTSGVLALAADGRLLVVGMPDDDRPVDEAGTVLVVEFAR